MDGFLRFTINCLIMVCFLLYRFLTPETQKTMIVHSLFQGFMLNLLVNDRVRQVNNLMAELERTRR